MNQVFGSIVGIAALGVAAHAGAVQVYTLTSDPADVPGAVVNFGDLPASITSFYDGTRVGATVESAREYDFMKERIGMGYREAGASEIRNTYFPGVATALVFRFDAPVAAAGAYFRGVPTAGIHASYAMYVDVYDDQGEYAFGDYVEFPEGTTPSIFVGVVAAGPTIKTIEFSPANIGGIGCTDLRPGGPAVGPCPGDANGDRVVDFLDLNIVLSDFGSIGPGLAGDVDFDGDCDFVDLNIVLGAFGTAC